VVVDADLDPGAQPDPKTQAIVAFAAIALQRIPVLFQSYAKIAEGPEPVLFLLIGQHATACTKQAGQRQ